MEQRDDIVFMPEVIKNWWEVQYYGWSLVPKIVDPKVINECLLTSLSVFDLNPSTLNDANIYFGKSHSTNIFQ